MVRALLTSGCLQGGDEQACLIEAVDQVADAMVQNDPGFGAGRRTYTWKTSRLETKGVEEGLTDYIPWRAPPSTFPKPAISNCTAVTLSTREPHYDTVPV
jgi:hypothetical protein